MNLKKVQIWNFRSIKHQEISFESHRCRVPVGINESGKSNLLDALSLMSPDRETIPEDQREQLPDENGAYEEPRVRFIFDVQEDLDTVYDWVTSRIIGSSSEKIVFKGETGYTIKSYCKLFKEALFIVKVKDNNKFSSHWELPDRDKFILAEGWKKPNSTTPDGYKFKDGSGNEFELKKLAILKTKAEWGIPEEYLSDASFDDFYRAVSTEIKDLVDNFLPEVVYWKYADNQLLPERIVLSEFIVSPDKCIPLKNMFLLAGIEKIKEEIEGARARGDNPLNNLLKRVATKSTEHFQKVWKEYREIKFSLRMNGEHIQCSISEKNDYAFQKRSDGFKRFVAFLLTVSSQSQAGKLKDALLLIDEPDSGLHPSGARCLRDELIKISKTNYVVYSTHSIFMIDRHNVSRHLIVKKKNEVTEIIDADEGNLVNEEVIFNSLNYSAFEHLKEQNILFEGWRDKELLRAAIKKPYEKSFFEGLGLSHAEGVKSFKWFVPLIELAERKAVIVSDNDKAAKEGQKEYNKLQYKTAWKRYEEISPTIDAKTGEDFVKKEYIVSKLKAVTKAQGKELILNVSDVPENDRLDYVKQKLQEYGHDQASAKTIIDNLKQSIFTELPKGQVEDRYYTFLGDLKTFIRSNL